MQSLYVILDYENSQFAVNGNYRIVPTIDPKPNRDPTSTSGSLLWIIIGSVVGVLVIVAIIGFICVRNKNKRLQQNLEKYATL